MNDFRYDIFIIGCGPAGISAATILSKNKKIKVALIDAGDYYTKRYCPVDHGKKCINCQPGCKVISGYGGSVHYGDSIKLSRFPAGKYLINLLGKDRADEYMRIALDIFGNNKNKNFIFPKARYFPFKNVNCYPVATLSYRKVKNFLKKTYRNFEISRNIDLFLNTNVLSIQNLVKGDENFKVFCTDGNKSKLRFLVNKIIFAGGRYGIDWWKETIDNLGIKHEKTIPYFGLRFEGPKELFEKGGEIHPDLKISFYKKDYKIKTFCFCGGSGGGRIKTINYGSFNLLDGHVVEEQKYDCYPGNFALIMKNDSPSKGIKRVKEIISKYKKLNLSSSGKPVFQLYKDFRRNKATAFSIDQIESQLVFRPSIRDIDPSNLASLFTEEEHSYFCAVFEDIFQWLYYLSPFPKNPQHLNKILDYILVLGIELENLWDRIILTPDMESSVKNIYVAGDATGLAQGILQAMVSGIAAAKGCLN